MFLYKVFHKELKLEIYIIIVKDKYLWGWLRSNRCCENLGQLLICVHSFLP